ncbi:MAG: hypothetical protein ACI4WX_09305 [Aristaeellaceae bacterium]
MKRISVFVCMLLMLSLLCLVGVASAETEEECQHYAYCTAPTVCAECGYEGEIEDILHDTDDAVLVITPAEHQYRCPQCGEIGLSSAHFTFCTSPNACTICGYEGEIEEIIHLSIEHNPETHVQTCLLCDAEFTQFTTKSVVEATCTTVGEQIDVCDYCGEEIYFYTPALEHYDIDFVITPEAHQARCNLCGELGTAYAHFIFCDAPGVCYACGYEGEFEDIVHTHIVHDPETHVQTCTECGAMFTDFEKSITPEEHIITCNYCEQTIIEPHTADCTTPNVCSVCGYEGEMGYITHQAAEHDPKTHMQTCGACGVTFIEYEFELIDNPEEHFLSCTYCTETVREPHMASCTSPNVCAVCGYEGEIAKLVHENTDHNPNTHAQTCTECGAMFLDFEKSITPETHTFTCTWCQTAFSDSHAASCTAPTVCIDCGYEGEIEDILHNSEGADFIITPDEHQLICSSCGKLGNPQAHYAPCTSPNTCHFCGYEGEIKDILHPFAVHDPDTHVQTCILCDATFTHFTTKSVAEATCTADGLKTASCSYCDEDIETVLPALGHDWKLTDRIAPTCTTEGYNKYTCRRCNWWTRGEVQPALSTAECTMLRAEIGDVVCTVCPVCASTALTPETEAAVTLVENAAAEGTDAQVIVREAVPEANLSVKRIFCVRLVKDSTDVQPGSTIRLRIPCAEAQGLTLLHLSESGELTEIACELTGGTLVFETDKVGVFLLVEAK